MSKLELNTEEQYFWKQVYVAAMAAAKTAITWAEMADLAVLNLRERQAPIVEDEPYRSTDCKPLQNAFNETYKGDSPQILGDGGGGAYSSLVLNSKTTIK